MMWRGYPWTGAMMLWMSIWGIIWLVALGVAIWALVRWVGGRTPAPGGPPSGPSALEIVRQRYARREIDAATFDEMRRRLDPSSLEASGGPGPA